MAFGHLHVAQRQRDNALWVLVKITKDVLKQNKKVDLKMHKRTNWKHGVSFFLYRCVMEEMFTCRSKTTEREQVSASSQQGTLSTLMENVPFLVPQASSNGKRSTLQKERRPRITSKRFKQVYDDGLGLCCVGRADPSMRKSRTKRK